MNRRFLILHGLENRRPRGHWQWWLADRLRAAGEQVLYPQFPAPEAPDLDDWLDLLGAEYAQLGDGDQVVVAHSLGCALWCQAAMRAVLPSPADRVLLVAPPGPAELRHEVTAAFAGALSAAALRRSSVATIRLVASDADPYCTEGPAADVYGEPFGLDAETIPGAGHLSVPDGFGPWPRVLDWCLDPATRFSGGSAVAVPRPPSGDHCCSTSAGCDIG